MTDWLKGFLAGVIATIIGFILTMLWDTFKLSRESKKREKTVLSTVKEELINNLSILQYNQTLLQRELELVDDNKRLVAPLNILQSGFWDLVKINLPKKLTKEDTLIKIRTVAQLTDLMNETIRSRENFRIHNMALSGYGSRIKLYDEILLENIGNLLKSLESLQPLL